MHPFLKKLAREHGWQIELPGDSGRAAFNEQERRRRKQAWALLRQGKIMEGYRTGVFGRTQTGAWHPEVLITGTWRGRRFSASQVRRYELTSGETTRRRVRRRASVSLADGPSMDLGTRLRRGRLLRALNQLSEAPLR